MNETTRERALFGTFARLADTLVGDYDVVDLLQLLVDTCGDLLEATAAGILLADENGDLELVASTSEATRLVEMMQLSAEAGPCIESFTTGKVASVTDVSQSPEEWSRFRDSALEQGFHSVYAIPLRLRDATIGTLNLMRTTVGALPEQDLLAAQAFADVATIGILQERALREANLVRNQLQSALNSRILIEQAKGVVAHTRNIPMEQAFDEIRSYSRSNHLSIATVAAQLIDRSITL